MERQTISYSDKIKGWTSFHSFFPDQIGNLTNDLFTIKNGQLYIHNDKTGPFRNNFYGQQFKTKVVVPINPDVSDDKVFKTMVLEGNKAWDVSIKTNLTESTIKSTEFNPIESRFFAHVRQNENVNDLHGNSVQGIGRIVSFSTNQITFSIVNELVCIGDKLFQLNGTSKDLIGQISNIVGNTVTVSVVITVPIINLYCFATKNARVEGSEVRGYYAMVTLENDDTDAVELFGIESNVVKSHV